MKRILSFLALLLCIFPAMLLRAQTMCNPQFTWSPAPTLGNSLAISFVNTTVFASPSPAAMPNCWISFGDNVQQSSFFGSITHHYATPGTYTVKLYMTTYDSVNQQVLCFDSAAQQVTVNYPCNASINALNTGNGAYNFTAFTPPPVSQIPGQPTVPIWHFGDNSPADSGYNVTHTYALSGTYQVTATVPGCLYPYALTISYIDSGFTCDSLSAYFIYNNNNGVGNTVSFYNSSVFSPSSPAQNIAVTSTAQWFFGDGNLSAQDDPVHTYNVPGIYEVLLVNSWHDSLTQNLICADSMLQQVPVGTLGPLNAITGAVNWDSMATSTAPAGFKVWLITHDTTANTLEAVDSAEISPWGDLYTFWDAPAGNYLVKAAALSQPAGISGWLPTYHDSSLYWGGAAIIAHNGGLTEHKDIWMQSGIATSGPGFIGGNISQGAGKGTGTGIDGILVFVRGSNGKVLGYTYTDEEGNYSFDQLATGLYTIYPEAINYNTMPSSSLSITQGQAAREGIDFEQTEDEIRPKGTTGTEIIAKEEDIAVYPNPAKDMLYIHTVNDLYSKATLINCLGQETGSIALHKGYNSLQTAALPAGIYYLSLDGKNGRRIIKISRR